MVLMGMGAYHGCQFLNALLFEVRDHQLAVLSVAAVNEHILALVFQQDAVCLAHINIVDDEGFSFCDRGGGFHGDRDFHNTAAEQKGNGDQKGK